MAVPADDPSPNPSIWRAGVQPAADIHWLNACSSVHHGTLAVASSAVSDLHASPTTVIH
jgi:hypothetical protein